MKMLIFVSNRPPRFFYSIYPSGGNMKPNIDRYQFANMPELPQAAQLTNSEQKSASLDTTWLGQYLKFANQASPQTPPLFHTTLGLALLSTAVARRVFVRAGQFKIYPNIYALLISDSTLYSKTSGLQTAEQIIELADLQQFLLPDNVTPESFMAELSHTAPPTLNNWSPADQEAWNQRRTFAAQRAWLIDESARILKLFKQSHGVDMSALILRLFDCPSQLTSTTIRRGQETIHYPYLTLCGPTTPESMRTHLKNTRFWEDGFFARCLLVTPDRDPVDEFYSMFTESPDHLANHINRLAYQRLPMPQPPNPRGDIQPMPEIEAQLSPGIWERWRAYKSGLFQIMIGNEIPKKAFSLYGRMHTTAIKIATLLAVSSFADQPDSDTLIISTQHWAQAHALTEQYRASMHRLLDVSSNFSVDDDAILTEKIISRIRESNNGLSARDLGTSLHLYRERLDHLKSLLVRLVADGILYERTEVTPSGPNKTIYSIR
jgi:hypothetical protein